MEKKLKISTEAYLIDALKLGDNKSIKKLYNNYRNEFFVFSRKYNIYEDDISDIYQEAFIALRKHAISGRLYYIKSSLKTYLFGIGKHLIYKKLKDAGSKQVYDAQLHNSASDYEEIHMEITESLTQEQETLRLYFKQLGKSCQQMLTLSFYRGLTNDEIATLQGYDSEAVVRSQKSRCLKTLKDLIKNSTLK
ncbi:sigma-70 family RNA polymerase sigma factor [Xanthomarina sp.]|uniref:RNA polymerase sigma factor n=1 Tax=Xanthomarina sp. TaxID=1931211 RepID=UPI002C1830B5|nr:sigma-70 family RNA polymerase sigma factor [Xanthomarina sp.]HLV39966.1 sigma-70 family RNA polymerase sigma factor [Xanthomarina sp.]